MDFEHALPAILEKEPSYAPVAYFFLKEALAFSVKHKASLEASNAMSHVSGADLLEGFRLYALEKYGPLSYLVLTEWGLSECSDVGKMVFALVDAGVLSKQPTDSIEDFYAGYDFKEAFYLPFVPATVV